MLELPSCLLLDPAIARVCAIAVEAAPTAIVLTMHATPATAPCPVCGQTARRIHSHYHRTLADVSWALVPVRIDLQVRRFFCDRADCQRRIFTERRPTIMEPYARRTSRLAQVQQQIGVLVGGSAGAIIGAILVCPAPLIFSSPWSGVGRCRLVRRRACSGLTIGVRHEVAYVAVRTFERRISPGVLPPVPCRAESSAPGTM